MIKNKIASASTIFWKQILCHFFCHLYAHNPNIHQESQGQLIKNVPLRCEILILKGVECRLPLLQVKQKCFKITPKSTYQQRKLRYNRKFDQKQKKIYIYIQ